MDMAKVLPDFVELSLMQIRGDVNIGGVYLETAFSAL